MADRRSPRRCTRRRRPSATAISARTARFRSRYRPSADPGVAAAGVTIPTDDSRATIGTADVGVFGGTQDGSGQQIYRLGFLIPSASREQPRLPASARVGDEVLELPRTAGVRLSHSRIWIKDTPWTSIAQHILRLDLGLDVAGQYATDDHRRIVHVIPRAGVA